MKNQKIDIWFLLFFFLLILYSTWILFSSSSIIAYKKYNDVFYYANKQLIWHIIGICCMFISIFIPIYVLKKYNKLIIYISIIFLSLVFVPGISKSVSSDSFDFKRWIQIGAISFQPSEFVKISYLLYLSCIFEKLGRDENIKKNLKEFLPIILVLILLFFQPQYGTMIILILVFIILLYIIGYPIIRLLLWGISLLPVLFLLGIFQPYRWERIKVWLNPYEYKYEEGYQLIMSFRAFKEGGLFGSEIYNGIAHSYLTFGHTDFIFALIGEQLGLMGVIITLLLFFLLFFRSFQLIKKIDDFFSFIFSLSIIVLLIVQVLINICVTTGLLPTTGIGLPFFSYGGSSLISFYIMMGLFLNLTKQ